MKSISHAIDRDFHTGVSGSPNDEVITDPATIAAVRVAASIALGEFGGRWGSLSKHGCIQQVFENGFGVDFSINAPGVYVQVQVKLGDGTVTTVAYDTVNLTSTGDYRRLAKSDVNDHIEGMLRRSA